MTTDTLAEPARPRSRLSTWADRAWYEFWKNFVWLILRLLVRFRYEGRVHEPRRGPFIVAANHASFLDPPLVAIGLRHKSAHMGKDTLFDVPILGSWLRSMGTFPVRRGTPDRCGSAASDLRSASTGIHARESVFGSRAFLFLAFEGRRRRSPG